MKCPSCGKHLERCTYHGITLDRCMPCGGLWFDKDELNPFLERWLAAHEDTPYAPTGLVRSARATDRLGEAERACPRCACAMGKLNYAYDSNIILDRCPSCQGIWLDRGEVERLAMFMKGNPKIDRLAASIADHAKEREEFSQFVDGMSTLGSRPIWFYFAPRVVLPLSDDLGRQRFPGITLAVLATNVAVFLFTALGVPDLYSFFSTYGLIPAKALAGEQAHAFLTHMFLHAGFIHLLGNMLFLWIFADNVEDAFGHLGFIPLYLVCGLAGIGLHAAVDPASMVPCIGASGAIAGMMGAYLVLHPEARINTLVFWTVIPIPAVFYIVVWFAFQLLNGFLYQALAIAAGVAWFAHIGGFLAGAVIAGVFKYLGVVPIAAPAAAGRSRG